MRLNAFSLYRRGFCMTRGMMMPNKDIAISGDNPKRDAVIGNTLLVFEPRKELLSTSLPVLRNRPLLFLR